MTDHPFADRLEIAGEIEFCHGFAVTGIRPHHLVGMGDDHAHHLGGFALRLPQPRLARLAGFGCGLCDRLGDLGHGRLFRLYLIGRLVLAQALERSLPDIPRIGKACEFDFGDKFGLQPMHIFHLARRILAAERAVVRRRGLQRRRDALDGVSSEAGSDHSDKGQMIAAIDARHQRAEFAVGGFPPSEHDLMSGPAFGLGPTLASTRLIGRAELLRDDAFQRQLASRLQDGFAPGFKMLDIADQFAFALGPRFQQFLQLRLSIGERQGANIRSIREQQIEREENEIVGLAVGKCGLQRGKIRHAVMVERDDLAVNKHIGE